jgi:hypothetical protein
MDEKPLAFLSLVKLLEEAVGEEAKYTFLDPFPCRSIEAGRPQIIAIQNAGKIISQHLGMADHVFVISVVAQKENTAGHNELDHSGREVFVEISPEICKYNDAVLATLSHELSHKFLHLHGIRNGALPIEQEFLTDVTAVYLGLGKIMVNGCECRSTRELATNGRTTTETHTLRTGYISRECFAFVYRLICAMRGIPSKAFLGGLSTEGREAVLKCEREYADWFQSEFRSREGVAALVDSLEDAVSNWQNNAASRHLAVRRLEGGLGAARKCINDSHQPILEARKQIARLVEAGPNTSLTYLECLESRESVNGCLGRASGQIQEIWSQWRKIDKFFPLPQRVLHQGDSEVVECPIDGTKLRVPANRSRLLVTCPSCKYRFVVNTTSEFAPPVRGEMAKRRRGVVALLKSAFRFSR